MKADCPAALVVLARAPVAGRVKTRLIPELGITQATAIYLKLLERVRDLSLNCGFERIDWYVDGEHEWFDALPGKLGVYRQPQGDLGARMLDAIERSLQSAHSVILIGSDCPYLTPAYLDEALKSLDCGQDVVIGPASDGGYVLIGMRAVFPVLFTDIDWGTEQVLAQTRERLRAHHLNEALLEPLHDIDTAADYRAWARSLLD